MSFSLSFDLTTKNIPSSFFPLQSYTFSQVWQCFSLLLSLFWAALPWHLQTPPPWRGACSIAQCTSSTNSRCGCSWLNRERQNIWKCYWQMFDKCYGSDKTGRLGMGMGVPNASQTGQDSLAWVCVYIMQAGLSSNHALRGQALICQCKKSKKM